MQAENIYNRLGEDLNKWQALLVQIRKARGTFDNAETRKEFGPVIIDYGKVSLECDKRIIESCFGCFMKHLILYRNSDDQRCAVKYFEFHKMLRNIQNRWSEVILCGFDSSYCECFMGK